MPSTRSPAKRTLPPLNVEALWQMKRIGSPTLSPDGREACAPVTTYSMQTNEGLTQLWLFPTGAAPDGGRAARRPRRLTAGDKDSDPTWSPDGKWIAFTAKRKDDKEPQVYLIAPDGGEARRLTKLPTGAAAVKWFADSRRLAFISWVWPDLRTEAAQGRRMKERADDKVKAHITQREAYRYWDHWLTDGREPHIFVCDIGSGVARDVLAGKGVALTPWEPGTYDFDLAPDGQELAFAADLDGEPRMMNQRDIVTVNLVTGQKRTLTTASGLDDCAPCYSPDGRLLALVSHDTQRSFNDQGQLRCYDRKSGVFTRLVPKFDRAVTHLAWEHDSTSLLCLVEDRGRVGLCRLPLNADAPHTVAAGGTLEGYARSADGKVVAFVRSTAAHPPALFACRGDGTAERAIESFNRALLARHATGEVREYTIPGWHGEAIQVWVTYPPGFDPKKKWPLLHSIHGGPHAAHHDGWHFRWNSQVFAGQGYVVVGVNYHGSSGFGQKFLETITRRYGEKEFADVEAATDHLIKRGYIDRTRLVATGGSYGGYMVAFMNGHTGRYKAYVCHAGCYDWVSMMATDGYKFFASELGAFHWEDSPLVMGQSPHHYVKAAKTPTLVIHGALDYRVPDNQGLQYYNSLQAKGIPTRLVFFPDENHWILKPQNSRLWYREFFAWVAKYARGGPARLNR